MNKLIIVGNGFDLAHGLPTSYKHFIDDFWRNLKFNYENEKVKEIVGVNPNYFRFLDSQKLSKIFQGISMTKN